MRYVLLGFSCLFCATAVANDNGEDIALNDVLEFAQRAASQIDQNIHDYTCLLMRQEQIDGRVRGWQYMQAKIRHENREAGVPFSVYLKFLKPSSVAGREVLYVQGGDLIARRGGTRQPNMTVFLDPNGKMAMDDSRYPITEVGVLTLAQRLIEVLREEQVRGRSQLRVFQKATVDGRSCTHYRLTQPQRTPDVFFYTAEVSVDNQLGIPIFYRAFDWPKEKGGAPVLLEQYYYKEIRINVGLTDQDFDPKNPDYHFQIPEALAENENSMQRR